MHEELQVDLWQLTEISLCSLARSDENIKQQPVHNR